MRQGSTILRALVIILSIVASAYLIMYVGSSRGLNTTATSTSSGATNHVTFYCGSGNSIQAVFATSSVVLMLSDGTTLSLPQTISGSGIRYESNSVGSNVIFVSKGDSATLSNSASTTDMRYTTCITANITSASTAGYENYTDRSSTFSFIFPKDFSVSGTDMGYNSQSWAQGATTTGMELARIDVPQNYESGTNFGNAWFTVGASSNPSAVATCLVNTFDVPTATTTRTIINGVLFTKMTFTGAGAGNRYDTTSYRAIHAGMCYAIEYTIHYGVLQNYPKGAVTQFNEQKIRSALDHVAQSFRFL